MFNPRQVNNKEIGLPTAICFLAIVIIAVATASIAGLAQSLTPSHPTDPTIILERWRHFLKPEEVERTAYVVAVLTVFPTAFLATQYFQNQMLQPYLRRSELLVLAITISFTSFTLVNSDAMALYFPRFVLAEGEFGEGISAYIFSTVAILIYFFWFFRTSEQMSCLQIRMQNIFFSVLCAAAIIIHFMLRLRTSDMIYGDIHLEPVLYSISQVIKGKTVLADLPTQYGLYAELLKPAVSNWGTSVLSFSKMFGALFSISLLAIFSITYKCIHSFPLKVLCLLSLIYFVGSTWIFIDYDAIGREYFQVWHIRTLFPAIIGFLICWRPVKTREGLWLVAVSILASLGLLWNIESGVAAYGGLLSVFVSQALFGRRGSDILRLGFLIFISILTIVVFFSYLNSKSEGVIDVASGFAYQKTFYLLGFGMLPLPLNPHPWIIVLGIYLFAIARALTLYKMKNSIDAHADILLFLSVCGIGLFTYYQGRSHDVVLSFVLWPAIIIAFMLTESCLLAFRRYRQPAIFIIAASQTIIFGVISAYSLLSGAPTLIMRASSIVTQVRATTEGQMASDVRFILANMDQTRETAIFAPGQSVLFLETGLFSAISGPGYGEMLLTQELENYISELLTQPVAHVFIAADEHGELPDDFGALLAKYEIAQRNEKSLIYLRPRTSF